MDQQLVRCIDCRYHHPRFCGYTKLREEGGNTASEDSWHGCRDFSPGRPPDRDKPDTQASPGLESLATEEE